MREEDQRGKEITNRRTLRYTSSSSSACGSGSPDPWCHVDRLRSIVTPLSRSPSKHWSPPGIAALSLLEEVQHSLVVLYTSPKNCYVYVSARGRNRLSAANVTIRHLFRVLWSISGAIFQLRGRYYTLSVLWFCCFLFRYRLGLDCNLTWC
ncbi:jg19304 [Pararge aegeria aegeria]|uniref:Jg19304 protein n=1 Tax=Pararge aegeria aegeria TaxID=348720 RepID=A0A8S4QXA9_9NEOP|nr:jg19304 [Pararge aegeria aegeria]